MSEPNVALILAALSLIVATISLVAYLLRWWYDHRRQPDGGTEAADEPDTPDGGTEAADEPEERLGVVSDEDEADTLTRRS